MKKDFLYRLFSNIPPLETERLRLRGMRVSDAEDMYAYAQREDVTRYLLWAPHPDVNYTKDYLTYVGQRYRTGDFYDWAITLQKEGRLIGTCGFTSFDLAADAGELGYVLNPAYGGQGLATEAVGRLLDFGFGELGLHRIEARFMQGNDPSRRLMERVGMRFEGWSRDAIKVAGRYRTVGRCAILANEWRG